MSLKERDNMTSALQKGRMTVSQQIEIEFKNLLTEAEFNKATAYFNITSDMFAKQVNHYFETPAYNLKDKNSALRIREKDGKAELTLKQPAKEGLLETNQTLSASQVKTALETGNIPEGIVMSALFSLVGSEQLHHFGSLITRRAETPYKSGLIALDISDYLNKTDYEIEYEVVDAKQGQETFLHLLNQLSIPLRDTENKIKRFYNEKYKSI